MGRALCGALCSLGLLAGLFLPAAAAPESKRPLTVDDVLKTGMVGQAQFSPDGSWLAWNVTPPYDQLADYSWWLSALALSGHQLWVMETGAGAVPRLQPGLDPEATNWLAGFSPDGSHVVVLEHRLGRLRFVACETGEDSCQRLDVQPDLRDGYFTGPFWNERLEWVSPEAFVMPVRLDGVPGSELHSRAATGAWLTEQWQAAWAGNAVTATEVVSPAGGPAAIGALVEFNVVTGYVRTLAQGRFAGQRAAPGGRYVAAARVGPRRAPPPNPARMPDTHAKFDRRHDLVLIDRVSGEGIDVSALAPGLFQVDPASISWSADGNHLAVWGWDAGARAGEGGFHVVDVAPFRISRPDVSGLVVAGDRPGTDPQAGRGPARAVFLGDRLAVFARPEAGRAFAWYLIGEGAPEPLAPAYVSQSGQPASGSGTGVHFLADGDILRIGENGRVEPLPGTDGLHYGPPTELSFVHAWSGEFRFGSPAGKDPWAMPEFLIGRASDSTEQEVVFLSGGQTGSLTLPEESQVLTASGAAGAALVSVREGRGVSLHLVRDGEAPQTLARLNTHLDEVSPPVTLPITYSLTDPEGVLAARQVEACLTLPPDYQPGRRYPVVIEVYPVGTGGGCQTFPDVPRPLPDVKDLWASLGAIHVRPPLPLDFARTADGPMAGTPALLDQTAEVLIDLGYADPGRIALYGFSQGALPALYSAARSDRFAAVIAMNGWADLLSHYFGGRGIAATFHLGADGGDNRWRYDCEGEGAQHNCPFGFPASPFGAAAAGYALESPVTMATDITAPVLLIHSDMDYFSGSQFDEMFGALQRVGREARYVRYWGEGHGPSSPANIRDLWARFEAFLNEAGFELGAEQAVAGE